MNCKYCFRNKKYNNKVNVDWKRIIDWIVLQWNINEINIAGGEPTLAPFLLEMVKYCNENNLKTSLITNGFILDHDQDLLNDLIKYIDCIGISVDSLDNSINSKIGRCTSGSTLNLSDIENIYQCVKSHNKIFKINTVISKLNIDDISIYEMKDMKIDRYKLLKNNNGDLAILEEEFVLYCNKFNNNMQNMNPPIIESKMNDTYIKIISDGILDSNSKNEYNIFKDSDALIKALNDLDKVEYKKRYRN